MRSRLVHHRGVATLEFALSLPLLLVIFVGIVWLGFSVTVQSSVTAKARHKAWEQRFDSQGTPLLFLKDDFVTEEATGKVEVSPLFDDWSKPESSHDVMAGGWDHRNLKLDKTPNWVEYAKAAANAKTGKAQIAYTDARNEFNSWKNASQQLWSTMGQQFLSELTGLGDIAKLLSGNAKSESANTARERQKINQKIRQTQSKLDQAKRRLKELQSSDDKDRRERIAIQKNKIKRLENDLREQKSDLDDLD
jgi:hypothetical protein